MASTKGAIIYPCLPALQSAACLSCSLESYTLGVGRRAKNKTKAALWAHIKSKRRRWAIKASASLSLSPSLSLSLSPSLSTTFIYLFVERGERRMGSLAVSLTAVLRFEPAMIYRVARPSRDSGANERERVGFITRSLMGAAHTHT